MYERVGLAEAAAAVGHALTLLAAVDLDAEDDRAALEATVEQQRLANRLAAEQLRLLGHVDGRGAYQLDAAVTLASWYRARTRLDHGEAARRVTAAARLQELPLLTETFAAGEITHAHVTAVTEAATPDRAKAIAECEQPLVALAMEARPCDVRRAVARIRDLADPDGTDTPALPECGPDARRELHVRPLFDGLWETRVVLDQLDTEALLTALDAADTPDDQPRTPPQRRADAFMRIVHTALDSGALPAVQGSRAQVLLTVDLATLLGSDTQTARAPRLRFTGDLDVDRARHLALRAAVTAVLTMGPWRIVNVGRRFRTLPPWLRTLLEVVHRHCRGPDCDRPITWTEAHHAQRSWEDGADTDLNTTVPLCKAHHDLVTVGGWTVHFNPDTGTATWTHQDAERAIAA